MPTRDSPDTTLSRIDRHDHKLKVWLKVFVITGLIVFGCLLVLAWRDHDDNLNSQAAINKLLTSQGKVLDKLDNQGKKRDKNLQLLIDDNAKQTVILCSLIVQNGQNLTAQQAVDVQQICKQEIQRATDELAASAASQPSQQAAGQPSAGSSPSNSSASQPATPAQPQQPVGVDTPFGRVNACVPFTGVCAR